MIRVLVTGGAGYVGSHCCKALAARGFEPVVYDNLTTGHRSFVRWGPLVEGDVRDADRISSTLAEVRPAAVIHFAALSLVGQSAADPGLCYDVNVVGTLRLLEAMRRLGPDRLVFSSTCAVYGDPGGRKIAETMVPRPVNPYGASKLACERMMDDFGAACGLRSMQLRYFNAAGADPDGEIGEAHDPETHLVPLAIEAALGRIPALRIFGDDYPTPDGTPVRDYVHVCDLADAHLAALDHLLAGGQSAAVNLGTGRGVSILELLGAVEAVAGRHVPREVAGRRSGDAAMLVADPGKAASLLNWSAKRDLGDAVGDAFRWSVRQAAASADASREAGRLRRFQPSGRDWPP